MLPFLPDSFISALPVSVDLTSPEGRIVSESKICWIHFLAQFSTDRIEMWYGVFIFQIKHYDTTLEWWDKEKRNIHEQFLTDCSMDASCGLCCRRVKLLHQLHQHCLPGILDIQLYNSLKHEGTLKQAKVPSIHARLTQTQLRCLQSGVHAGQQATKSALLRWAYRGLSTKIHKQFAGEQKLMKAKDSSQVVKRAATKARTFTGERSIECLTCSCLCASDFDLRSHMRAHKLSARLDFIVHDNQPYIHATYMYTHIHVYTER